MDADELKRRSRGISRDMSPEAISRRLEIVGQLHEMWQLLRTARRVEPARPDAVAEHPGATYGDESDPGRCRVLRRPGLADEITDYPSLFRHFRMRPPMWMGVKSLTAFENQLRGIWLAEHIHAVPTENHLVGFDFAGFEAWVAKRHNPRELTVSSFSLARRMASDEAAAFDLWFEWVDAFLVPHGTEPI